MSNNLVRTRFAPSPTGMLHVGGLRSALFNYLFAKNMGGEFLVRLEDTDQSRLVEGAREQILSSMEWLGLDWDFGPDKPNPDFGPLVQSERLESYKKVAEDLIELGFAYRDWTSSEQLGQMREQAQTAKKPFVFRKTMATLDGQLAEPHVIRVDVGKAEGGTNSKIVWTDARDKLSWDVKDIDDFVALKSDGFPTYQLANVVDDHAMGITHVIRADEWLSSTPKHIYLYDALDWDRPEFIHLPAVMGPGGKKKLSKRDGAKDAEEYKQEGYLPQALMNYLALLGWNPGTEQEIFTPEELINAFSKDRIQKSGANFDETRLDWMNGMHIRALGPNALTQLADLQKRWPQSASTADTDYKEKVMTLVFERLKKLSELEEYTHFFFEEPTRPDSELVAKETGYSEDEQKKLLKAAYETLQDSDFTEANIEEKLYGYAKAKDLKVGKFFMLLRMYLTGGKVAPGLFETINTLGKDTVSKRLSN